MAFCDRVFSPNGNNIIHSTVFQFLPLLATILVAVQIREVSGYIVPKGSLQKEDSSSERQLGGGGGRVQCLPCESTVCGDWRKMDCKHGFIKDACDCCFQCARFPGELCGGSQNVYGTCGIGTYCRYAYNSVGQETQQSAGTCYEVEGLPDKEHYVPRGVWVIPPGVNFNPEKAAGNPKEPKPDKPYVKPKPNKQLYPWDEYPWLNDGPNNPSGDPSCKAQCTPELCGRDKRAVCSATNRVYSEPERCENQCHHTSCLACSYAIDIAHCGQCGPKDNSCLKKFGVCIKALRRKLQLHKNKDKQQPTSLSPPDGLKFACSIPACPKEV